MTVALLFQEYGLEMVSVPSALTLQGPFSPKRATSEEHPGPPVIQRTTGKKQSATGRRPKRCSRLSTG